MPGYPARNKAMQLLERQDRSRQGLSERLRQAGFSDAEIQDALAYVTSFGYLDDSRYARNRVRALLPTKSRLYILKDLAAKGIDPETAQEALEEELAEGDTDPYAALRKALRKKRKPGSRPGPEEKRRIFASLARRGFSYEDMVHVWEEWEEESF